MRYKDLNTTDIYATRDGSAVRYVLFDPDHDHRYWYTSDGHWDRSVRERLNVARISSSSLLALVDHSATADSRETLANVTLPQWTTDPDQNLQIATAWQKELADNQSRFVLQPVAHAGVVPWDRYVANREAKRQEAMDEAVRAVADRVKAEGLRPHIKHVLMRGGFSAETAEHLAKSAGSFHGMDTNLVIPLRLFTEIPQSNPET